MSLFLKSITGKSCDLSVEKLVGLNPVQMPVGSGSHARSMIAGACLTSLIFQMIDKPNSSTFYACIFVQNFGVKNYKALFWV
jgi:hypothetical protein